MPGLSRTRNVEIITLSASLAKYQSIDEVKSNENIKKAKKTETVESEPKKKK